VALCAPTGKAAKRMAEITQFQATTIHRLLGGHPVDDGWVFEFGPHNLLSYKYLICDEASMLDVEIGQHLFGAVGMNTRVFLIGDADQLPPVGPGQVLADTIRSGVVPVSRLTHLHRAAAESWVCRNAAYILNGDIDLLTPAPDFRFYDIDDAEKIAHEVVKLVTVKMPEAGVTDVQVLTPQNAGILGVESLNLYLQSKLNPVGGRHEEHFSVRASKGTLYNIRGGDVVMATENDYTRGVFNGEIGKVMTVDREADRMMVDFDGRNVLYDKESARQLRLAYALTVHKAQGSEWDWVVVVCHDSHEYMWSQQLLYTAVTRAKKGVVIVGNRAGVGAALINDEPKHRMTTLENRLREAE
jgi:exodeoxyribonuclease V alpha subunit